MNVERLAAFTRDGQGGNPAGVVVTDKMPVAEEMQKLAYDVGFSETAFASPQGDGFRVRYFAPEAEVPFCGHATIALGAALGAAHGAGTYRLILNAADISVRAYQENGVWGAELTSPQTRSMRVGPTELQTFLDLFSLTADDLDPDIAPAFVNGGAQHLLIPLRDHALMQDMAYTFDAGARLMQDHDLVTINLIWRENPERIHSRNAFAGHGVYEDPATGAAAAALAGYLRDAGHQSGAFEVLQGAEMGSPSRLRVAPQPGEGAPVRISGLTRRI